MNNCNHDWERIHPIKIETMIQNLTIKYPNYGEFINSWFYENKYSQGDTLSIKVCLNCEEINNQPKRMYNRLIPLLEEREKRRELALSIYEKHNGGCNE